MPAMKPKMDHAIKPTNDRPITIPNPQSPVRFRVTRPRTADLSPALVTAGGMRALGGGGGIVSGRRQKSFAAQTLLVGTKSLERIDGGLRGRVRIRSSIGAFRSSQLAYLRV